MEGEHERDMNMHFRQIQKIATSLSNFSGPPPFCHLFFLVGILPIFSFFLFFSGFLFSMPKLTSAPEKPYHAVVIGNLDLWKNRGTNKGGAWSKTCDDKTKIEKMTGGKMSKCSKVPS